MASVLRLAKPLEHTIEALLVETVGLELDPPIVPGRLLLGIRAPGLEYRLGFLSICKLAIPIPSPFTEDEPMAREESFEEPERGGVLVRVRGWGSWVRGQVRGQGLGVMG